MDSQNNEMNDELKHLEKRIQLVDENTKRQLEIFGEKLERVTKTVENLTPENIAEAVRKARSLKDIERINDKDETANTLGFAILVSFGLVVVLSFVAEIILILNNVKEGFDNLEKVIIAAISTSGAALTGVVVYYFGKSTDAKP